jgi:hypothetical protein
MPARQNRRALSHTRRKCLVNTISLHLAKATTIAARHAGHHPAPPLHLVVAGSAIEVVGVGTIIAVVVIIILVAALASAVRSLAALMSELLRVASAVTSLLFSFVIATFLGVAFLMHH